MGAVGEKTHHLKEFKNSKSVNSILGYQNWQDAESANSSRTNSFVSLR